MFRHFFQNHTLKCLSSTLRKVKFDERALIMDQQSVIAAGHDPAHFILQTKPELWAVFVLASEEDVKYALKKWKPEHGPLTPDTLRILAQERQKQIFLKQSEEALFF